jgi:choline dehydrogenase-like flavoprotein
VLATHKVAKVLFDKHMTAKGVAFLPSNSTSPENLFRAYAAKAVILSAGALASAPILERSGIGKASILRTAGVKPLIDLPGVGANLNVIFLPLLFVHRTYGQLRKGNM